MRVLWVHNFPCDVESSGVFMFILAEELQRIGVSLDLLDTGSLRGITNILNARAKIALLSRKYDLVHAQFGSACALVASSAVCPKVLTLRGSDMVGSITGSRWHHLHSITVRWMTRHAVPHYQRVIVMSQRMRDELRQIHGRSSGVEIIPSGIISSGLAPTASV